MWEYYRILLFFFLNNFNQTFKRINSILNYLFHKAKFQKLNKQFSLKEFNCGIYSLSLHENKERIRKNFIKRSRQIILLKSWFQLKLQWAWDYHRSYLGSPEAMFVCIFFIVFVANILKGFTVLLIFLLSL